MSPISRYPCKNLKSKILTHSYPRYPGFTTLVVRPETTLVLRPETTVVVRPETTLVVRPETTLVVRPEQ